jgi:hypothetical protein
MDWTEIIVTAAGASLPAGLLTEAVKIALRRYERRMGPWWDWCLRTVSSVAGSLTILAALAFGLQVTDPAIAVFAGFGGGLFATAFHATLRRLIRTLNPTQPPPPPPEGPPGGDPAGW